MVAACHPALKAIKEFRDLSDIPNDCKTCHKKLKISLCFDGTDCNEEADKIVSSAQPPSDAELQADTHQGVQAAQIKKMTYPRQGTQATAALLL